MADPRSHRRYKKLRAEFKEDCEAADLPCWICAQPIDYRREGDEEASFFELDHLVPVAEDESLALDPANFRPSHAGCNARRGKDMPRPGVGSLSRNWLEPLV